MPATPQNKSGPAGPCCMVIFGATGDLNHRLLLPALYNLAADGLLPKSFAILGFGRTELSTDAFRDGLRDALKKYATRPVNDGVAEQLFAASSYMQGDMTQHDTFIALGKRLEEIEAEQGTGGNRLFYLATPPAAFGPTVKHLAEAGLTTEEGDVWRRVIIEKPFGTDLDSARALNRDLLGVLDEDQIYRMDHYLGKETVQNIMITRFANGLFEPIWNRDHIDHVQITVAETVNVERRGRYFDVTGTLRDMVPNHLFQLMSLIAMDPPTRFDANAVRQEKANALEAISIYDEEEVFANSVRAQYGAGQVKGADVIGYRNAQDVRPDSTTETYAALKLGIDNWRWAGVPFYLRTGKALARRKSEIAIRFKEAPVAMFRDMGLDRDTMRTNYLVLNIQPEEGMALQFNAKVPGPRLEVGRVGMTFNYKDYFEAAPSTGYETLIYDCMIGDAMLFQRADGVEAGWRAVQPFLDAWKHQGRRGMVEYPAGSEGPDAAAALLQRDGRHWRSLA